MNVYYVYVCIYIYVSLYRKKWCKTAVDWNIIPFFEKNVE